MRRPSASSLFILLGACFLGCDRGKPPPPSAPSPSTTAAQTPLPAPAPSAGPSVMVAPSASAAVVPPADALAPCTVDRSFVIDRNVRLDAGLTELELDDHETAIGYAVATGEPRVAIVAHGTGGVTKPEVDWSHVRESEKVKEGMVRRVLRVTPISAKGGKARVGYDSVDTVPGKKAKGTARSLRCGAADKEPIVDDHTPLHFLEPTEDEVAALAADEETVDVRDCRTFTAEDGEWAVSSVLRREAGGDNHNIAVDWTIDTLPGRARPKEHLLAQRILKPLKNKSYPALDHFYSAVSVNAGKSGFFVVSRDQGSLVLAHRTDKLEKIAEPVIWRLDGAARPIPQMTNEGEHVFLMVTETGQHALFGSTWHGDKKPIRPARIRIEETDHLAPVGERDSVTVSPAPDKNIFVGFTDGADNDRARVLVLDPSLKPLTRRITDVSPEGVHADEARIVALSRKRAFVAYLEGNGTLTGVMLTCAY